MIGPIGLFKGISKGIGKGMVGAGKGIKAALGPWQQRANMQRGIIGQPWLASSINSEGQTSGLMEMPGWGQGNPGFQRALQLIGSQGQAQIGGSGYEQLNPAPTMPDTPIGVGPSSAVTKRAVPLNPSSRQISSGSRFRPY